jgi:transcriptional regulator GlxA family with amidase domain
MLVTERVAVVMLPPCSMLGVGAVAELFDTANRLAGKRLYELGFYSRDGQPLVLQNGLSFPVRGALRDVAPGDRLFVLSEGVQRFAD